MNQIYFYSISIISKVETSQSQTKPKSYTKPFPDDSYAHCATRLNLCEANATQCARANVRKTLIIVYLRKKLQQLEEQGGGGSSPLDGDMMHEAMALRVPEGKYGQQRQVCSKCVGSAI